MFIKVDKGDVNIFNFAKVDKGADVTFRMSCAFWHMPCFCCFLFFFDKFVKLFGQGSDINRA